MAIRLIYLFVLLAIFGIATVASATVIQPRMINGAAVDTLRRFPHHVTIEPVNNYLYGNEQYEICGGSILNQNWILTSSHCVRNGSRLNLHIQRLYRYYPTGGAFTIAVNNDPSNVIVYPTEFDDIALIKLPVNLVFSDIIKPISILETSLDQQQNKLAVLPGFDSSTSSSITSTPPPRSGLTYAMLSIVSNSVCKNSFKPDVFDEFLNVCANGWGNSQNAPCLTDFGSGLIVDWPANPKLFGIYSNSSYDCYSSSPSIYVNVQKYKSWIDSVIANN